MYLEQAKNEALELLASSDAELSIEPYARQVWLGIGYCVAKGWAVYRGNNHYNITTDGLAAYREHKAATEAA